MAWRPGVREHVLAYSSGGHVDVVDTDSRERLARILLPHVAGAIAWSADGRRLYVNLGRSLAIYDARGRRTGRIRMPGRLTVTTFAPARSGELVAVARRDPDGTRSDVALMGAGAAPRILFSADGRFTRLRFSPTGSWLLVAWPDADQWVFIRPGAKGAARVLASPAVSRRFGTSGFPQVSADWCCGGEGFGLCRAVRVWGVTAAGEGWVWSVAALRPDRDEHHPPGTSGLIIGSVSTPGGWSGNDHRRTAAPTLNPLTRAVAVGRRTANS